MKNSRAFPHTYPRSEIKKERKKIGRKTTFANNILATPKRNARKYVRNLQSTNVTGIWNEMRAANQFCFDYTIINPHIRNQIQDRGLICAKHTLLIPHVAASLLARRKKSIPSC